MGVKHDPSGRWFFWKNLAMAPIHPPQRIQVFMPKLIDVAAFDVLWEYAGWGGDLPSYRGNLLGTMFVAAGADPTTPESRQIMENLLTLNAIAVGYEISEFIWTA